MFYKNARIFTSDFRFVTGALKFAMAASARCCPRLFPKMPLI